MISILRDKCKSKNIFYEKKYGCYRQLGAMLQQALQVRTPYTIQRWEHDMRFDK
jgi:hypothetical protein